jgi:PAS domain-containing protein
MAATEAEVGEAGLGATIVAALDGASADACLDAAVSALAARGLAEPGGVGEAWLDLQRGERGLRLVPARGVEPPEPRVRALLGHVLCAALARAAECDEARKVNERLDLLRAASFEGILIHDGGVAVDCNERLCEMIGYSREEKRVPWPEECGRYFAGAFGGHGC